MATPQQRLRYIGIPVLALGLLLGALYPIHDDGQSCGTAFFGSAPSSTDLEIERLKAESGVPLSQDDCDGVRAPVRTWALGGIGAGGALVLLAWVMGGSGRRDP